MQPGDHVSHYRILSKLGSGGMGEVWLARDTQLNRNVAVKVLHQRMADDPEWMKRFVREARSAAGLNHPNIAQIHELCEDGSRPMIVMEYIEGQTLCERIRERPLTLEEMLAVGIQVSSALEEAHSKGVVHRDIKPGNIMLTSRGLVKVLDFGLAKQFEARTTIEAGGFTVEGDDTQPGEIRGTLRYMSREQCMGGAIDHRSDLFSLGAVLYEMATGQYAFMGATPALIYDAILNRTPAAPGAVNPKLPPELDRVILKCLQKSADQRYFSAGVLRQDLEKIQAASRGGAAASPATTASRMPSYILATALVLFAAAAVFLAVRRSRDVEPPLEAVMLTSALGTESQPSFSPDGNQVVYTWNGEGEQNWDIYVKLIQGGPSLRLTTDPGTDYSPAWSPDGKSVAFLRVTEGEGTGFYLIPALGGVERKIASASTVRTGVEAPFLAWSPDGKKLAIADKDDPAEPTRIHLLDLTTGERRRITNPPVNTFGDSGIVFHPNGEQIFFVRSGAMGIQDIHMARLDGGEPVRLTNDNRRIYGIAWNPADQRLLFSSSRSGSLRLWRLAPAGGEPMRVVGTGVDGSYLAVAAKGNRLAFTKSTVDTNVWSYSLSGNQPPRRLISSTKLEQGAQYSPDGLRIAFGSTRTGAWEVFVCDADGSNPVQITQFRDKPAGSPHWSPDGRFLVYDGRPDGNADIFMSPAEGGPQKRLTEHPAQDTVPTFSRDGKHIYFGSNRTGRWELWKMPASGGEAVQVTKNGGFYGIESADGKYLYYARSLDKTGLYRMPLSGGDESQVLDGLRPSYWGFWALRARDILYADEERLADNSLRYVLKSLDLATGKITPMLALNRRPFNSGLALAPDGKSVLYTQADRSDTDIMLVEGFR